MDTTIERRKLNLVQNFLLLENNETITKIESLLNDEKKRIFDKNFSKKMTQQQLDQILIQSEKDFENGNFYQAESVKTIIENW